MSLKTLIQLCVAISQRFFWLIIFTQTTFVYYFTNAVLTSITCPYGFSVLRFDRHPLLHFEVCLTCHYLTSSQTFFFYLLDVPFKGDHTGSASISPSPLSPLLLPTVVMSSFTTCTDLLCGLSHFLLPVSSIFNIIYPVYPLLLVCTCSNHLNPANL